MESEADGQKAEELDRLEAPDYEGELVLAQRNRIIRWRKPEDQRPTFHFFGEDDDEEQACGGVNHWVQRNAEGAQWTW